MTDKNKRLDLIREAVNRSPVVNLEDAYADRAWLLRELDDAVNLVRRYFWCESRREGREIDSDAMAFLDAHGGRDVEPNGRGSNT